MDVNEILNDELYRAMMDDNEELDIYKTSIDLVPVFKMSIKESIDTFMMVNVVPFIFPNSYHSTEDGSFSLELSLEDDLYSFDYNSITDYGPQLMLEMMMNQFKAYKAFKEFSLTTQGLDKRIINCSFDPLPFQLFIQEKNQDEQYNKPEVFFENYMLDNITLKETKNSVNSMNNEYMKLIKPFILKVIQYDSDVTHEVVLCHNSMCLPGFSTMPFTNIKILNIETCYFENILLDLEQKYNLMENRDQIDIFPFMIPSTGFHITLLYKDYIVIPSSYTFHYNKTRPHCKFIGVDQFIPSFFTIPFTLNPFKIALNENIFEKARTEPLSLVKKLDINDLNIDILDCENFENDLLNESDFYKGKNFRSVSSSIETIEDKLNHFINLKHKKEVSVCYKKQKLIEDCTLNSSHNNDSFEHSPFSNLHLNLPIVPTHECPSFVIIGHQGLRNQLSLYQKLSTCYNLESIDCINTDAIEIPIINYIQYECIIILKGYIISDLEISFPFKEVAKIKLNDIDYLYRKRVDEFIDWFLALSMKYKYISVIIELYDEKAERPLTKCLLNLMSDLAINILPVIYSLGGARIGTMYSQSEDVSLQLVQSIIELASHRSLKQEHYLFENEFNSIVYQMQKYQYLESFPFFDSITILKILSKFTSLKRIFLNPQVLFDADLITPFSFVIVFIIIGYVYYRNYLKNTSIPVASNQMKGENFLVFSFIGL